MQTLLDIVHLYEDLVKASILSLPRLYAFLTMAGILNASVIPRLARNAAVVVLSLPLVPINLQYISVVGESLPNFMFYFAKEYAVGFVIGFLISWIFWAVTAAGDLIDNQRGAAIASSVDPLLGQETTPFGILFSQAFLTYFYSVGGMLVIVGIGYKSFVIWPVTNVLPVVSEEFPGLVLGILDLGMRMMFIVAAPVVALMFLSELALALVSRFAPQIQVFILAMPIKSAIAVFALVFYIKMMFPYMAGQQSLFVEATNRFFSILQHASRIP